MRRLVQATVVLSFLALSGCVFSALDKQVDSALGTIDDASLATGEEAATIVTQDWEGLEGSADIKLADGVLTVVCRRNDIVSNLFEGLLDVLADDALVLGHQDVDRHGSGVQVWGQPVESFDGSARFNRQTGFLAAES